MSDSISRKALLEDMQNTITEHSDTFDWINLINRQPTAYDADKVLNKLENKMLSADLYGDEWDGQTVGNLLCMGDVYEIIKGGGLDE